MTVWHWVTTSIALAALLLSGATLLWYIPMEPQRVEPSHEQNRNIGEERESLSSLRRQIRRLSVEVDGLRRQVNRQSRSASTNNVADIDKRNSPETAQSNELADVVAERVEAKLADRVTKIASRRRTPRGEWIAPIDELSEALKLDSNQIQRVTDVFDAARDRTFELLNTPRADGGSLVNDLADDIKGGMSGPAATQRFVKRIFTETMPDGETKYLDRLIELRGSVFADLAQTLTDEQNRSLENLQIDPLRVETGYDPIKAYVEQAVDR